MNTPANQLRKCQNYFLCGNDVAARVPGSKKAINHCADCEKLGNIEVVSKEGQCQSEVCSKYEDKHPTTTYTITGIITLNLCECCMRDTYWDEVRKRATPASPLKRLRGQGTEDDVVDLEKDESEDIHNVDAAYQHSLGINLGKALKEIGQLKKKLKKTEDQLAEAIKANKILDKAIIAAEVENEGLELERNHWRSQVTENRTKRIGLNVTNCADLAIASDDDE